VITMKFDDLQKKTKEDLKKELDVKHLELLRMKAQVATGAAGKDSGKVREVKRTIARIHTLLNSKDAKKTSKTKK